MMIFGPSVAEGSTLIAQTQIRPATSEARKEQDKLIASAYRNVITSFQNKNFPETIEWAQRYVKEGGGDPQVRRLLAQAYFLTSDYVNSARELQADMLATERSGKPPDEDRLLLLLRCYTHLNDTNAQSWVLEKLVTHYPKKTYWNSLLTQTQRRSDFRTNLALDVQRLRLATGTLQEASEYLEMAQNAVNAGLAGEARFVIEQGFSQKVLGTGMDAATHQQIRADLTRRADEQRRLLARPEAELLSSTSPSGLMSLGMVLVIQGDLEKGLSLMEKSIAKIPSGERPQDARLHLAIAYLKAGRKPRALETFGSVGGVHGSADLARLWSIYARGDVP